ncbi:MAG: hypothetical protein ACI9IP_003229 [Arcticibacterium sp.]|jgi:hypothetical protein
MKYLILFAALCQSLGVFAQSFSGRVVDENGQGIPEVTIANLSQNQYHKTDFLGNFDLGRVSQEDSLSFKMIGYGTKSILYLGEKEEEIKLEPESISLAAIEVKPELNALKVFADVNLDLNPVNSTQDLLRLMPGLFTGQHAGGGKAEQVFLRGFDIDHGTDLSISVDGMPVNMVSHAHGQGYADLHFVIPETIEGVEFSKGSYQMEQGNFATAGSVSFKTKERLEQNKLSIEYGSFNHKRALGLFNIVSKKNQNQSAYIASEYIYSDGPFESPQNFNRFNALGKWTSKISNSEKISLSASHFTSRWNASGQIPQRAVDSGLITRFGSIDDTEGGQTSRTNTILTYNKSLQNNGYLETKAYYTHYDFLLFSNFTFFDSNPIDGDQIKQAESRNLFGFETSYNKTIGKLNLNSKIGLRKDLVADNELARTKAKIEILESLQYGDIDETNAFAGLEAQLYLNKWQVILGLRLDHFNFRYSDNLLDNATAYASQKTLLSPKLNFIYQANPNAQYYLKMGTGFHSNDSRAVTFDNVGQVLPRSYGADLGSILKPSKGLLLNAALWFLKLDQEFVYVGDEGIVEPSGQTRRFGADVGIRAELSKHLFFDSDITYSNARSLEQPKGQNYIPLAPAFTLSGGLSLNNFKGFSGSLKTRVIGNRPANEAYSLEAKGYWITDANVNYEVGKFNLGLSIQNLFNATWNETQFATESRLFKEENSVEEIHFTPGSPFSLKASVSSRF